MKDESMAETVTLEALTRYTEALRPRLSETLADELHRLGESAGAVPNWLEGGAWLREHDFSALSGHGPMSKILRAVAYTLEQITRNLPAGDNVMLTGIRLSRTVSGCSTYMGLVEVHGERDGAAVLLLDGRFVWDCSAWDVPQSLAAQKRGYACMVEFPEPRFASAP